ncbi:MULTISPECIES: helix-turn-helix transcriptional regulator [unclassified Brenneria]|uniref:helix-turn-helix transcriptional regulator n=1 Tax=unclassified Brenneria TaxID=2634434 RepID=UPI0029C152FC|nr:MULTISPECIES: helix-turn-helix transcriptional regulator [unclassified Brenneria]MDX5627003.1 helix-turn-helix transcriptional regulator [Brenneria sp. L3-3Z]MDX5693647.1 helix-turn-helix transcriptional regulator [Brenneria sp. L4-2C]
MAAPRTRADLAEFLRKHRERISPLDVGLPTSARRRTPGLRREEVAALAGVGLTWYTWLEQGRDIGASGYFLDRLATIFKLDAAERRHLYLLAHQRPPAENGKTVCEVPPLVHRLIADLPRRLVYVLNLRWDVLTWNHAADRVFHFSSQPAEQRNLLWMLYINPETQRLFYPWEQQAPLILASFKRDFARAPAAHDIHELVKNLEKISPDFKRDWHQQDVQGSCTGARALMIEDIGEIVFEHTTLTIDEERHLRLVYYAAEKTADAVFDAWLMNS